MIETNDLISRFESMRSDRALFDREWQDVRDNIQPISGGFTTKDPRGRTNRTNIYDDTAETASDNFSGGLHGILTNPGTVWFGMRAKPRKLNDDPDVTGWLDRVVESILFTFSSEETLFETSLTQLYSSVADFGTTSMFVWERPGKLPLYRFYPLSQIYLQESVEGAIDTVVREFTITARQAGQMFGKDLNEKARKSIDANKPEQEFRYLHFVEPRADAGGARRMARDMPWASFWLSMDDKALLREGGYRFLPYQIGRWKLREGDIYGRGPGSRALPHVKMLQRVWRAVIRSAEKMIDPVLLVGDDGVLGQIKLNPGAINTIRTELLLNGRRAPIEKLDTGGRPDIGVDLIQQIHQQIKEAYYNHLLQLERDPRMTATQALMLGEESMRQLGPFIGRIQQELLAKIISATYQALLNARALPPAPSALRGARIEVEYVSPMVKAQRASEVAALIRYTEINGQIAAFSQNVGDNLDADEASRFAADRLGVPRHLLRSKTTREAMRAARGAQIENQAKLDQMAQVASAAQSAGQAAGALKDAAGGQSAA